MIIEVYVTGHAHDKDIDKFIFALFDGRFRNYQSIYSDSDFRPDGTPYPNVRVIIREREEIEPLKEALTIYQGISALFNDKKDIEVRVNDSFVGSANATFEPVPAT